MVVIISQYIHMSNHCILHFELETMLYVNYISVKKKTIGRDKYILNAFKNNIYSLLAFELWC